MREGLGETFIPFPGSPEGESPEEGIALLDDAGTILAANEVLGEMFRYDPGELVGLALCRLIAGGAPCRFEHLLHPPDTCAARSSALGRWLRVAGVRRDGSGVPFDMTAVSVPEGKGVAYVVVIRDCGSREGTEALLRLQSTALEAAANAIVITDPGGTILWVNPAFTRLTGYSPEEVLGKNPRILKSGAHPDSFFAGLWKTVTSGTVWKGQTVNRKKDGSLYVEEQTITPVRDRHGINTHFIAIKSDITARKNAEESLREKSAKLEERVKELRCLYEVSELLRRNDITQETLLAQAAELLPAAWLFPERTCARLVWEGREYRTENYRESGWKLSEEILVHGIRVGSVEVGYLGEEPAGGMEPFLPEERALIEAVAHLLGNSIERRWTEVALRASERQYRLVVENVREVIFQCDTEGRWSFLNPAWENLLGYPVEESLGKSFLQYVCPEDHEKGTEMFRRLRSGEADTVRDELRGVTRFRETRWYEVVAVRLADASGEFTGTLGTFVDITRRKEVERLKSDFVATVSHELRTPITSIKGALGLLAGGVGGVLPPQAQDLLDIARRNCERLGLLIDDLLDMEKIESGKMVFSLRALDLLPLVEQVVDGTSAYAGQFGVTFRIAGMIPGARVKADPDRLAQVLTNLLSNAAKFSPRDTTVEVSLERREGKIRVAVRDQGPGVPVDFRPRIFERFAQADGSEARRKGGTGLGLSISRAIVERLGGLLDFESREGEGTTFYFELPELEADHGTEAP